MIRPTVRRIALGLLAMVAVASIQAADPPEKTRNLTEEEQKEVARLGDEVERHSGAGKFEEAAKTAKQIVEYRAQRQGPEHWEVIDARLELEHCQRLTSVPEKDRKE